jgi:creatinine amidohydrolase
MDPMEATNWGFYSDLRPAQIEAIRSRFPVAYVPWGALEWHSYHAPVGLDSVKAEGLCVEIAKRAGGLVFPVIPLAVNTIKPYKGFAHCLDMPVSVMRAVARSVCEQLVEEGFRVIIFFTGHYPPEQLQMLRDGVADADCSRLGRRLEVWADNQFLPGEFQADHAGATETAFQLAFRPETVDLTVLPERVLELDRDGLTGDDPRKATVERGRRQVAAVVQAAAAQVSRLLMEAMEEE